MKTKQLLQLGIPHECLPAAISAVQAAAAQRATERLPVKKLLPQIVQAPRGFVDDAIFGALAQALLASASEPVSREPIAFTQFGDDIDEASKQQMRAACRIPVAAAAALMPDAHVGYGLPIGGVLACENAVVPYAVGVDIACRMRLTITDLPVEPLDRNETTECRSLDLALAQGTRFGTGSTWQRPQVHDVMDDDWSITPVTNYVRDTAWKQLGTSGSGNHFVEWGVVELPRPDLGLAAGRYVALLSHSGSRGAGAQVCRRYTELAQSSLPHRYRSEPSFRHLAWLMIDSEAGREYWDAMNLMGRYAAANHEVIHRQVTKLSGAQALAGVENHHNFAWLEQHGGREVVVHRKGATPAQAGVLGVIPGNMAAPAFIVRGRGQLQSLHSAAHGAGRAMSRTAAKQKYRWGPWRDYLQQRRVRLLAGGLDEVPGAYKDIHQVMAAQRELVDEIGQFHPRIVMMCGDGSRAED